jgi:NADH-quinone oxidoreductase subunit M
LGLFHVVSVDASRFVVGLAIFSLFYASICSMREVDAKRLIAYTSIAHMGMATAALFLFDENGFYGAIVTALGHSVTSSALFFLVGVLYVRLHTRDLTYTGGLAQIMPIFSTFLFLFAIANAGFPYSLGFVGELLSLISIFRFTGWFACAIVGLSLIILLYSNLRLFSSMAFGAVNVRYIAASISDLNHLELFCAIILSAHAFILMVNFNHFFFPLFVDLMGRYI